MFVTASSFQQSHRLAFSIPASISIGLGMTLAGIDLLDGRPFQSLRSGLETLAGFVLLSLAVFAGLRWAARLFSRAGRRRMALFAALSLTVGLIVATFAPHPAGQLMIFPQRLQVSVPAGSGCSGLTLQGFESDRSFISYHAMQVRGWERVEKSLVLTGPGGSLAWQGYTHRTSLKFRAGAVRCTFSVSWNGTRNDYRLDPGAEFPVDSVHPQPGLVRAVGFLSLALSGAVGYFGLLALLTWIWGRGSPLAPGEPPARPKLAARDGAALALVSAVAFGLFLFATHRFGTYLWTDSASYISAGRSLAGGEGYVMMDGGTYIWWPPLYPILLSFGYRVPGLAPLVFMRFLNAALFTLTCAGWGWLFLRFFPGRRLEMAAFVLVTAFSPALLETSAYILSEPLFFLAIAGFFLFLERYIRTGSLSDAVWFSFFAGLAALARYVGAAVVLTAALAAFVFCQAGILDRILRAAGAGAVASFPTALWLLHNQVTQHSLTGPRTPSVTPLAENLLAVLRTLAGWFAPQHLLTALLVLGLLLAVGIVVVRPRLGRETAAPEEKMLAAFLFFAGAYTAWIVISLSVLENAPIENRLLSPISLPVVMALTLGLARLPLRKGVRAGVLAVFGLMLAAPAARCFVQTVRSPVITEADHLSIYSLRNDRVLQYLETHPLPKGTALYSNCPRCLTVFLKLYDGRILNQDPQNEPYLPEPGQTIHLVWFTRVQVPPPSRAEGRDSAPLPDLAALLKSPLSIQTLEENPDGGVYRIQLLP